MILELRCQLFKILVVMFFMVGSTFVGNCQAERTPVSVDSHGFFQDLIGPTDVVQFDKVKQNRQQVEKRWVELRQYASGRAFAAKQKLASLNLGSWWKNLSDRNVSPLFQQQPVKGTEAGAISATAIVFRMALNTTALQWLQASNVAADLFNNGHQQVAQATSSLEARVQSSLVQLMESVSISLEKLSNMSSVSGVIQAMTIGENFGSTNEALLSNADSIASSLSTENDPTSDPYWQYYADCDFWGAQFEAAKK